MGDFFIPFFTIAVAEMLDKSQLAILLLASRYKNHTALFGGIMLAFLLLSALAILAGSFITTLIPPLVLKYSAGALFILFGVLSFRHDSDQQTLKNTKRSAFITGFTLIFLAELGDKTQLATALFATQYNAWLVFAGAFLALTSLAFLAIKIGGYLEQKLNKNILQKIAGVVFILLGALFILL